MWRDRKPRLAAIALLVAIAGCTPQSGSNGSFDQSVTALDACNRPDVQDAVGKETRSIMLKGALPHLVALAIFGLANVDQIAENVAAAEVSFSDVALQDGTRTGNARTVACTGNFKFDTSNAMAGQDVVQIKRLRWAITFGDDTPNFASSNFTIEVTPDSIYENIAVNGQRIWRTPEQQAQDGGDHQAGAAADQPQDAAGTSQPADEAGITEDGTNPQQSPKPPSEDDLYAPHGL